VSLSINWATKVISIPQSYLAPKGGSVYELDVDVFRKDLKSIEDSEEGITFPDTHFHNTEVIIGGMTLARVVSIINGYTITFGDGQYIVNLVGANNNILDVTNLNQVSIRPTNSAGLIIAGSGVTQQDKADIAEEVWTHTDGLKLSDLHELELGRWKVDTATKQMTLYKADGQTPLITFDLKDADGFPAFKDIYERVPVKK